MKSHLVNIKNSDENEIQDFVNSEIHNDIAVWQTAMSNMKYLIIQTKPMPHK